jgi:hypothetical protein
VGVVGKMGFHDIFDKNITMDADEVNLPLEVEWDDLLYRDMTIVLRFPENVTMVVAARVDEDGFHRVFRVSHGNKRMYVYYIVDRQRGERYMYISKQAWLYANGFEDGFEDGRGHINPDYFQPEGDPVFDHPIFDLTDEI